MSENKDLAVEDDSGCDSTPHPPAPSALDKSPRGVAEGQSPPTDPPPGPDFYQKSGPLSGPPARIHVVASFDTQADLLNAMARHHGADGEPTGGAVSWTIIGEAAVMHALAPSLSHVYLPNLGPSPAEAGYDDTGRRVRYRSQLRRLDDLSLPDALQVIRRLSDELQDALDAAHGHGQPDANPIPTPSQPDAGPGQPG